MKALLDCGAVTADPGLEAFLRRKYRLPEREGMALPAASVRGDSVAAANARKSRKRTPAEGQMALPIGGDS